MCTQLAAALLAISANVTAQVKPQTLDSAGVASVLSIIRSLTPDTVHAVDADTTDATSVLLAIALANALQVPGPRAPRAADSNIPVCIGSREPRVEGRPRGSIVLVAWHQKESGDAATISVGVTCRLNGEIFGYGSKQGVRRGPNGEWHKDGPEIAWIS